MPATHCPKILAFVEGTMERIFVNTCFPHVELVPLSNGKTWSPKLMAIQISSKFITKNYKADYIVVWVDCEKRDCSASDLEDCIKQALIDAGASPCKIFLCIPNKMTENIILADEALIRNEFQDQNYVYRSEGLNGKVILKEMFKKRSISYKETYHGVQMLKKMRLKNLSPSCVSAKKFHSSLPIICWWL